MIQSGLNRIWPHRKDFSLLHTFGTTEDDVKGLPANFSIYDGRTIPSQLNFDLRFNPPIRPLPYACTAESGSFAAGLEDNALYRPDDLYDNTPPGTDGVGRDIRAMLETMQSRGLKGIDGTIGHKQLAYFNCYGSGNIDDFDAARIGVWINQSEKRSVIFGIYWYPEFMNPINGSLQLPSFRTYEASLHCPIITGWRTNSAGALELEVIPWIGGEYGLKGLCYVDRAKYNALMAQPYTAAFTTTDVDGKTPIPIGWMAIVDHLLYWFRSLSPI